MQVFFVKIEVWFDLRVIHAVASLPVGVVSNLWRHWNEIPQIPFQRTTNSVHVNESGPLSD